MKSIFKKYTLVQICVGIFIFMFTETIVTGITYNKALPALIEAYAQSTAKAAVLRDRLTQGCK